MCHPADRRQEGGWVTHPQNPHSGDAHYTTPINVKPEGGEGGRAWGGDFDFF